MFIEGYNLHKTGSDQRGLLSEKQTRNVPYFLLDNSGRFGGGGGEGGRPLAASNFFFVYIIA